MSLLDTGTYGAKVQSWKRANPRDVLRRLIEAHPKAGKDYLFKEFRDQLRGEDYEDYLDSVIEYWFANNYHSLTDDRPATKRPSRLAVVRAETDKLKEKIKQKLLDMKLPNGKTLRDSTFGYVAKLGGGLSKIGAHGKPNQIVGKHLSETEVRKLFQV